MTDRYAVIGNPIAHSKSPLIHEAFARQTGADLAYGRLLGDPDHFGDQVREFFAQGGRGMNVTLPFKEAAWRLADESDTRASRAEAANTLIPLGDGRLRADNTDGVGLLRDLARHQIAIGGRRVLLLGAGGACRGLLLPLLEAQPASLVVANRTPSKALELAARFQDLGPVTGSSLADLTGRHFDLILNATSASLSGQAPEVPDACLVPGGMVYDLMYGDQPTAFMHWGLAQGASLALDGLGMLVEQAAEAFFLWRGVRPDTASVLAALRSGT